MKILFVCALKEESDGETTLFDYPIIHTGIGKINAGYKTALAIEKYKPEMVCNFGSCGSFHLPNGALVPVNYVFNGDMDAEPIVPYSITPFEEDMGHLSVIPNGVNCFTTETFITKEKILDFPMKKLDLLKKCSIFEMELYSVVKVCKELNVDVTSWKWVSDDGSATDWVDNCKVGYSRFKEKFLQINNG